MVESDCNPNTIQLWVWFHPDFACNPLCILSNCPFPGHWSYVLCISALFMPSQIFQDKNRKAVSLIRTVRVSLQRICQRQLVSINDSKAHTTPRPSSFIPGGSALQIHSGNRFYPSHALPQGDALQRTRVQRGSIEYNSYWARLGLSESNRADRRSASPRSLNKACLSCYQTGHNGTRTRNAC